TKAQGASRPAFRLIQVLGQGTYQDEGQVSPDGRVVGTYLHGGLDNDDLRASLLAWARGGAAPEQAENYAAFREEQFELLADLLEQHLNLEGLLEPVAARE
ncbi:MAG: cobyric acid synthase CobQ, partial [Desulfarculaceae bacterium]|nr:cobyric acid synthase CobQ [Desulfarculaceae bacterium]